MTHTGRWHPDLDPDQAYHDTVDLLRRHAEEKAQEDHQNQAILAI